MTGWSIHHSRRGCSYLHNHSSLAGEQTVFSYPLPSTVIQTRHQAAHSRFRKTERSIQVSRSELYLDCDKIIFTSYLGNFSKCKREKWCYLHLICLI